MELFIEEVRKQPCLWNPLHPDYRDTHVKDEAWQRVIEQIHSSTISNIQVAKIEWKKLRDNHRDALKRAKLGKNKLLPAQITTWKYAKAMQFLEPHMKYRITENIEIEQPTHGETSNSSDHYVTTTEVAEAADYSKKRRCVEHTSPSPKYQHDTDALESFFNCMLRSTREMPPYMQTQVKKKIFAVIIEAEERLATREQNPNEVYEHDIMKGTTIKSENFDEDSYNDAYC